MGLPRRFDEASVSAAEFADELVDSSPAVVLVFDRCLRWANAHAGRLLGHGPEELPGFDMEQLVHPESRQLVGELLDELARGAIGLLGVAAGDRPAGAERLHRRAPSIADLGNAQRFLSALRTMGCRFILDDFGKGLSSLGYLRSLPLDFLKIDGDFVRNMTVDPIQTALVASIHEIGDVMGLRTIAEFVEDEETLESVRRIGIDYAQGFLLARPEPLP